MNVLNFWRKEEIGKERINSKSMREYTTLLWGISKLQESYSSMFYPLSIALKSWATKHWFSIVYWPESSAWIDKTSRKRLLNLPRLLWHSCKCQKPKNTLKVSTIADTNSFSISSSGSSIKSRMTSTWSLTIVISSAKLELSFMLNSLNPTKQSA